MFDLYPFKLINEMFIRVSVGVRSKVRVWATGHKNVRVRMRLHLELKQQIVKEYAYRLNYFNIFN